MWGGLCFDKVVASGGTNSVWMCGWVGGWVGGGQIGMRVKFVAGVEDEHVSVMLLNHCHCQ